MDPTANLEEQRRIRDRIQSGERGTNFERLAMRLADLQEALDDWIAGGGFLPEQWRAGR